MFDLRPFCATEEVEFSRPYLWKPFSKGDYTYATDGRIMVRIPRMAEVGELQKQDFKVEAPLKGNATALFVPVNGAMLPVPPEPNDDDCPACDGRGTEHDCPRCECTCADCSGSGNLTPKQSGEIAGVHFSMKYLRMLWALPSVEIARPSGESPLQFKFDGGVGALMPMRAAHEVNSKIDIRFPELVSAE